MRRLLLLPVFLIALIGNPLHAEIDKNRVAAVTCAIISETTEEQSAFRVKEVNNARREIGTDPYLLGDSAIRIAIRGDICDLLVLNSPLWKDKLNLILRDMQNKSLQAAQELVDWEREQKQQKETARLERAFSKAEESRIREENRKQLQQESFDHAKNLFKDCNLPSRSTEISLTKTKYNKRFTVDLVFDSQNQRLCPSLVMGGLDRFEDSKILSPLIKNTLIKNSRLFTASSLYFQYVAYTDGLDKNIYCLPESYRNNSLIFNVEWQYEEKNFFKKLVKKRRYVGVDAMNRRQGDRAFYRSWCSWARDDGTLIDSDFKKITKRSITKVVLVIAGRGLRDNQMFEKTIYLRDM